MGKSVAFVNAFTAGEIGPDGWERTDLAQHAKGCAEALNFIPMITGPLRSRAGFLERGATAVNAYRSRLVPFVRSVGDAVFLELSEGVARVWTVGGDRIMDGGTPYQFAIPWSAARIARLWFKQEGDGLIVTDLDGGPTVVIKRFADTNWSWSVYVFKEGPWLAENPGAGVTLTPTAVAGTVTLNASVPVFSADDIGRLVKLRESDGNAGCETWTSGTDYGSDPVAVRFDGRVYVKASGSGKSGTTPPLHQDGTVSDGKLFWTFLHDGQGQVRITTVNSPTEAVGTEIRIMPTDQPTTFWCKQAYSAAEGWPRALVEDREERLVFAGTLGQPGIVDMTRTAGWTLDDADLKPGMGSGRVVDDDAVRLNVGGASRVVWMVSATALIAGCTDGEYTVSGTTLDDPVTPLGRRARDLSSFGVAEVAPVKLLGPPPAVVFVDRSRKHLIEMTVAGDNSVESADRSELPHHIHDRGLAEQAWCGTSKQLWHRLDDGGLAVMAYDKKQGVFAATQQPLPPGWSVESLASAPTPQGGDALMLAVVRVKAGTVQRRIWLMADRATNVFVDGAGVYDGPPTIEVGGLDTYEGEAVVIVAGGGRIPDQTVVGGRITLPDARTPVIVGQKMLRRFETLPIDMEGVGSTNGRTIKPTHAMAILTAVDALIGTDQDESSERVQGRSPEDLGGPVLRRLRRRVGLGGGASRDARLVIQSDAPFDLTIHAYRLEGEVTA